MIHKTGLLDIILYALVIISIIVQVGAIIKVVIS